MDRDTHDSYRSLYYLLEDFRRPKLDRDPRRRSNTTQITTPEVTVEEVVVAFPATDTT